MKVYDVDGKLLIRMKTFYKNAKAFISVYGETNDNYRMQVGMR